MGYIYNDEDNVPMMEDAWYSFPAYSIDKRSCYYGSDQYDDEGQKNENKKEG